MRTKLNRRKTFTSHYKSLCNHSSYSLMKLALILYDDCPYMGDGYSCHGTCSNLLALLPSKGLKKHGLATLSEHAPSPYEIMEWPSHHLAQSNSVMFLPLHSLPCSFVSSPESMKFSCSPFQGCFLLEHNTFLIVYS